MDCVLILFQRRLQPVAMDASKPGLPRPSWSDSLKMMTEPGFLNKLQDFNKDTINDSVSLLTYSPLMSALKHRGY